MSQRNKNNIPAEALDNPNRDKKTIHDVPQICLFDLDDSIVESLKDASFKCTTGSLGHLVRVPNLKSRDKHLLNLSYSHPDNLHEFDILIFNMDSSVEISHEEVEATFENVKGQTTHAIVSTFPENIFNPKALSTTIVKQTVNKILRKESIVIIFASSEESVIYHSVEINSIGHGDTTRSEYKNTNFYSGFPECHNKTGKIMKMPEKPLELSRVLSKHSNDSQYRLVFTHPEIQENRKLVKDPNFIPLLLNNDNEVISFIDFRSSGCVLVFPCVNDKKALLLELFNNLLPGVFPKLFPFHGEFGWLENGDYLLPGEDLLIQRREEIENSYLKAVEQNANAIKNIKLEFSFLHDLISETGAKLVSAVEHYLKWLDFKKVVNLDDTDPEILEEDLQIDCGDRFLVIEVKGIGGTSTDNDCSQISKIRMRRCEQRNKFDVFGLYIVNHQRYMPPETRKNPPFTENQMKDAVSDKRGLLTTYELYKAYFMVETGILTKTEIRERLFELGRIELEPKNLVSLGIAKEVFVSGSIAILNISDVELKNNMDLFVKKKNTFKKVKVLSMQSNDIDVETFSNGEVGVKLDQPVKKNSEFFVQKI
ncbi:MAG: hypothetical protein HYR68_14560 [Burkholderiales bacterium]|nr:hypothetical protein [Burkholderiales bacterium]MBI3727360.1 hypothetical protein [Burkholderiales bacterium]